MASREGRIDIVDLLLQNSADINIVNNNGATAICVAKAYNRQNIVNQIYCIMKQLYLP